MINVKILCNKTHLRYSVRRMVEAAHRNLLAEYPDLQVNITEISDMEEIFKYTQVMVAPGLVINEKLVYDLWIPKKEQVIAWLRQAIQEQKYQNDDCSE
jgi:uncharacterized membrane protein